MKMKILRCIIGNTLQDRNRKEESFVTFARRNERIRWAGIRKAWRDHINRMDHNQLTKIAKNGKPNIPRLSLDDPQNIGARVGYQHHRHTE